MNNSLSRNASPTRYARRLSDHVLVAFHHACDQGDIEVAQRLLDVLEFMVRRPPRGPGSGERRARESLVAAHERLWQIRHPEISAEGLQGTDPFNDAGHIARS